MAFLKNHINPMVKYLRISILLLFLFGFLLLAGEIFFVVTNSNRPDFYPEGEPQDMSSGLYSAYINQGNSDYRNIKSKCAVMVDFDLDKDPDLYYGWENSHYFVNMDGVFTMPQSETISTTGAYGLVAGDIDNNGYPDILKWRYNITDIHEILLNRGGHYFARPGNFVSTYPSGTRSAAAQRTDVGSDVARFAQSSCAPRPSV